MSMVQKPSKQRLFLLISLAFFLGSSVVSTIQILTTAKAQPDTTPVVSQESTLQSQEQGYKLVLQREPENQVALEGLANTRIEMNDLKGAIAPLETLVKLNPNRTDYVALLAEVKQKVGESSPAASHK